MKIHWVLFLCFFTQSCNYQNDSQDTKIDKRPNIILLLTDDQRGDALGYSGNPIINTPNLDRLASKGVYFPNAYVTTSICCISRASIFTGQYASRHGITDFTKSFSDDQLRKTYPILLKEAGYTTGFIGKYGIGSKESGMPESYFDFWEGFSGQGTYSHKNEDGTYKHLTSLIGDKAEEFISGFGDKQSPFCLSISFKAPHVEGGGEDPFIYDTAFEDLYEADTIPQPFTSSDTFFNILPDFFKERNEGRSRWKIRFSTFSKYQRNVKNYYRLISGVDKVVGRIIRLLSSKNYDQNTIIIFTSDNGFFLGEHGLAGKWYAYEESIRVPFILYDPRIPDKNQGVVQEEMVLNIDVAPTILASAGVKIPNSMQGEDLTRLLGNNNVKWRTEFFYEHHFDFDGKIPQTEGVIGDRYKYLRYTDLDPDYEVLYDLEIDPEEINNFADDAKYKKVMDKYRKKYFDLKKVIK